MKTRKIFVILIAIFFVFALVFCGMFILSVNKVEVNFSVSDKTDITKIQKKFDAFKGDNLLFLDTDEVENCLNSDPYFEITKVEKSFPNVLKVNVVERREAYHMEYEDKYYITTKDGILLNIVDKQDYQLVDSREIIQVKFDGVTIEKATLGKKIETSCQDLILSMYEMVEAVNLTDCIKSIKVSNPNIEFKDIFLQTYTGVNIEIYKANERGVDKILAAFNEYENNTTDYQKLNRTISVTLRDDGQIAVTWQEGN